MKVIIVGGGISGLACGIYLAKSNIDVTIYEKNHYAGGFLTTWKRKNSIIDGCIHWMLGTKDGTRFNKLWKDLGALDNCNIYHPNTFCTLEYESNIFHFYRDIDKFEKELLKYSNQDDEEIKIFIEAIKAFGVSEIPSDVSYELEMPDNKLNMNIFRKMKYYLKLSIGEVANRFNSKIIRFALKNCLINEHFSAYYFIQTLSNFMNGNSSVPYGCTKTVQDGMLNRYLSLGGKIVYQEEIKEVIIEDSLAKGIVLNNGKKDVADFVVLATDLHEAERLINRSILPFNKIDQDKEKYMTYSYCIASYKTKSSLKEFHHSLVKKIDDYNICGIKGSVVSIRHYGYDDSLINDGNTTIQVYLTTYENDYELIKKMNKDEYLSFKKELGEFFLKELKKVYDIDLELIDVLTPLTFERYNNSYKGTFMPYVLKPGLNQVIRKQRLEDIKNIILANQWLMLPGGTCVSALMGKFASQIILHDMGMEYKFK